VPVNIWRLKDLSDKTNEIDERFLPPYYSAELRNNRCSAGEEMNDSLVISAIGSVIATILVLSSRLLFYRIVALFPARSLFSHIVGSALACRVYIVRMNDMQKSGKFLVPLPRYDVANQQVESEGRQLVPWVTSIHAAYCVAHVLNVLGAAGRTKDVEICFPDDDFDTWDSPMFLIGNHWKTRRAFVRCTPLFVFESKAPPENMTFRLVPTGETFAPATRDQDMGLLQKMTNPATGYPVWVAVGWRGAGTSAATYFLAKRWRSLGWLYGKKPFGLILEMNDRDGWQQTTIVRIHPEPKWCRRLLHFRAWRTLRSLMRNSGGAAHNSSLPVPEPVCVPVCRQAGEGQAGGRQEGAA
jgi:hypothetical protein